MISGEYVMFVSLLREMAGLLVLSGVIAVILAFGAGRDDAPLKRHRQQPLGRS
jgi:hypothetical protein